MVEHPDGRRVLLAPSPEFVAATYTSDDVQITPVTATVEGRSGPWLPPRGPRPSGS